MKRLSFVCLVLCIVIGLCGYVSANPYEDGSSPDFSYSDDANYLCQLAHENNLGEYYGEALGNAEAALSYDSNYANAWNELGIALYGLGRYEEAFEAFDNAVEYAPNWHIPYYNIGLTFEAQGLYAEAALAFQEAINRGHTRAQEGYDRVIQYL